MLDNILSKYFIEKLYSYTNEKTILDIIKYNKTLQKRNNLSLINYKSFSDKYIYLESKEKGKGKEYNKYGDMIYEFLRGKRNGKGKEYCYYDYAIKFEGDYLNIIHGMEILNFVIKFMN